MSLQQKMNAYKKDFEAKAPAEALAVMHRATRDLAESGILSRTVKLIEQTVTGWRASHRTTRGSVPIALVPGCRLTGDVFRRLKNLHQVQLVEIQVHIGVTRL